MVLKQFVSLHPLFGFFPRKSLQVTVNMVTSSSKLAFYQLHLAKEKKTSLMKYVRSPDVIISLVLSGAPAYS